MTVEDTGKQAGEKTSVKEDCYDIIHTSAA